MDSPETAVATLFFICLGLILVIGFQHIRYRQAVRKFKALRYAHLHAIEALGKATTSNLALASAIDRIEGRK